MASKIKVPFPTTSEVNYANCKDIEDFQSLPKNFQSLPEVFRRFLKLTKS